MCLTSQLLILSEATIFQLVLQNLGTVGQIYLAVFALSGLVCFAAIGRARKFQDPDVRRGLVGLLATAGGWALLRAAGFLLPDPFRVPAYIVGLAIGSPPSGRGSTSVPPTPDGCTTATSRCDV